MVSVSMRDEFTFEFTARKKVLTFKKMYHKECNLPFVICFQITISNCSQIIS